MRIDIALFDLGTQNITEPIKCFLQIDKDHLIYCVEFYGADKNESTLTYDDTTYRYHEIHTHKNFITAITKYFYSSEDMVNYWTIELTVLSNTEGIKMFFKRESEATSMLATLLDWRYKQDCDV